MVEYEDGVEKEKLEASAQEDLAAQYAQEQKREKKSGLTWALYMIVAIVGIALFFGLFYFLFSHVRSWFY